MAERNVDVQRHRSGYTRIPGSDALITGPADDALVALEQSEPARVGSVDVRGHKLGRVVLREAFVPVVANVFDVLALDQEPEELALYMHLWRLSVGEERNFCRVSRAELERRVRISQLRLGKALAGLVAKGHIALVDRNREGTLYRVYLPNEVASAASSTSASTPSSTSTSTTASSTSTSASSMSAAASSTSTSARSMSAAASSTSTSARSTSTKAKRHREAARSSTPSSATPNDAMKPASSGGARSVAELVEWFAKHGGSGRGRGTDEVLEEVLALVEDGIALDVIREALERFVDEMPKKTPISELKRFVDSRE